MKVTLFAHHHLRNCPWDSLVKGKSLTPLVKNLTEIRALTVIPVRACRRRRKAEMPSRLRSVQYRRHLFFQITRTDVGAFSDGHLEMRKA
jgi:hypothetical protein